MSSADSLRRMANQIAANHAHLPPEEAAQRTAAHLRQFWSPDMRRQLVAMAEAADGDLSETGLSDTARAAAHLLAD